MAFDSIPPGGGNGNPFFPPPEPSGVSVEIRLETLAEILFKLAHGSSCTKICIGLIPPENPTYVLVDYHDANTALLLLSSAEFKGFTK